MSDAESDLKFQLIIFGTFSGERIGVDSVSPSSPLPITAYVLALEDKQKKNTMLQFFLKKVCLSNLENKHLSLEIDQKIIYVAILAIFCRAGI